MAMTEEEEAKVKQELADTKRQIADLLAKSQQDANDAKAAEGKRSKEKAGKVELDPDVVKEVAELKAKVAKLEAKSGGRAEIGLFNLFGEK